MKLVLSIMLFTCSITAWTAIKTTTQGVKYPASQTYINDKENTRFNTECKELNNGEIKCLFNQIMITHENTDAQEKELDNIKAGKRDNEVRQELENMKKKLCREVSSITNVKKSPSNQEKQRVINRFKGLCANPTRQNYIKFIETSIEEDKKTCKIFDKTYEEVFKYDYRIGKWISQTGPYGGCGFINISYLEKDPRNGFDKFSWNYTSRKIITNKKGSTLFGGKCSELISDEANLKSYGLGSLNYEKNKLLNCKYINLADSI